MRVSVEPQQGAFYDDALRVAKAVDELEFDGFFRSDHYLPFGGNGLPGPTDAWVTLGALARETSRVRLGSLLSPVTFRLPGPLAILVAQVDAMSGGRVELGIGAGWFEAEHVWRMAFRSRPRGSVCSPTCIEASSQSHRRASRRRRNPARVARSCSAH